MESWLAISPWPGLVLWAILYISDYYLTIYSARGFREIGHFLFEGSFELTPQFQKDVDKLSPLSKRHVILLFVYSFIIYILWAVFTKLIYLPWAYNLYLGMFLLMEVGVHMRHLRNIFLIREIRKNDGVDGEIMYRRWFSYKVSAFDFSLFGILFLIVSLLGFSTFFLGGAIMCFGIGVKHNNLAKKAKKDSLQSTETQ